MPLHVQITVTFGCFGWQSAIEEVWCKGLHNLVEEGIRREEERERKMPRVQDSCPFTHLLVTLLITSDTSVCLFPRDVAHSITFWVFSFVSVALQRVNDDQLLSD